jgi:hypothetical protein
MVTRREPFGMFYVAVDPNSKWEKILGIATMAPYFLVPRLLSSVITKRERRRRRRRERVCVCERERERDEEEAEEAEPRV